VLVVERNFAEFSGEFAHDYFGVIVNNMMIKDESKTFILIKNTVWVVIKFKSNKM
jgi:hypothetical protein